MTYFESLNTIQKKKFSPIYLFHGTESYLVQTLQQALLSNSLTKEEKETNFSSYNLEEIAIQDVIADAETYPFFGGRKVIIAQNPIFLKAKPDKVPVEHDVDTLQSYLVQPVDYSIIVFIAPYEKLDERKKITKLLKKEAEVVACQPVKEWDLSKWINDIAKSLKITVEEDVFELIIQEVGTNLLLLQKELEKMAIYVGEGNSVTMEVAEALLSHHGNTSGLKLVDAVISKDLKRALQIFKDLERADNDAIGLLALLASQFRTIFHVKLLKQKGYSQSQMAQQLKIHPYVIKMSMTREKHFSISILQQIIDEVTETDAKIKQGKMDKTLAFELLLHQLITMKSK